MGEGVRRARSKIVEKTATGRRRASGLFSSEKIYEPQDDRDKKQNDQDLDGYTKQDGADPE